MREQELLRLSRVSWTIVQITCHLI